MSSLAKQKARNQAYQRQFNLPEDEVLVDEFVCALQQKILLQGKLYISQNFACFYSNIFGSETIKILPASDITGVQLAKILFIPNSIKIFLTYETYFFASFLHRADAYRLLTKISRGESIAHLGNNGGPEAAAAAAAAGSARDSGSDDDRDHSTSSQSSVRSPPIPANSKVRHASLLSDNANRIKAENDRKRQDELQEAKKKMKHADSNDSHRDDPPSDDRHSGSDRDESPPPPPRKKKDANGSATPAKANGKTPTRSKQRPVDSDHDDDFDLDPAPVPKRTPSKKLIAAGSSADAFDDEPDGGDDLPTRKRKGEPEMTASSPSPSPPPSPPRTVKKNKKRVKKAKKVPVELPEPTDSYFFLASSNTAFALPQVAELKQAQFYAVDQYKTVDPLVVDLQQTKFKNKKLGLDAPDSRRRLTFQGAMKRQGGWSVVDRWCFLFNDFFLFTEYDLKKGTNYREKQKIELQHMVVDMRPPQFQVDQLGDTKLPNPFRLLDNNPAGPPCQYVCSTLTVQEKFDWGRRFTEAISRWHANPASKSTVDRKKVGWYHQFVRGLLPFAVINQDQDLLANLFRTPQKDNVNDIDQEGYTLLHLCVLNNTPALIPTLLAHGCDLRVKDYDGFTPVHLAVVEGQVECLRTLMSSKQMDVGIWHPIGQKESKMLRQESALWLAAIVHFKSNAQCADQLIRILLQSVSAMPNFLDERSEGNNMTLLEYCCFNTGMDKIAATLIEFGASIDIPNGEGLTPLSQACKLGNIKMISLLLQSGAQPNLRHHKMSLNSSIFYCRGGSGLDAARELVSYGARWSDMRNKDGVRAKDLFPSISQQNFLKQSEDVYQNQKPAYVENTIEAMKPPANAMTQNNRHDFESCCLCQMEFTLVNKREYCRRCGWNICAPCSTKRMIFLSSSKSKSRSGPSASAASKAERVCDGCYNLVSHRKNSPLTASKKGGRYDSDDDPLSDDDDAPPQRKSKGRAAVDDDDDEDHHAKRSDKSQKRPEPSGFKSIKRLHVDSDDDLDHHSDSNRSLNSDSDDDQPAKSKSSKSAKAGGAAASVVAAAPEKSKSTLSRLFSRKKDDPVAAAKAEAEKHQAAAKQKGRESEEEDDNFVSGRARTTTTPANTKSKASSKRVVDSDDDGNDEPPPRRSGRPDGPASAPNKSTRATDDANEPSRSTRQPGWSSRAPPPPDSDPEFTDSDAGGGSDDDQPKKKQNIFQRGLKSATGAVKSAGTAVKSAGSAVGGAMSGAVKDVARGVSKLAHTVSEKVTAVAVPVDRDEAEEDPQAEQRARRKEAARQRLKNRYPQQEEEEEFEEARPAARTTANNANSKAAGAAAKMNDAKRQAQRNQDLLYQMEDKGSEVHDQGEEFQSLTSKLKARAKANKL